jgi:chromosomal replication initiation ATPase DnaA
MIPAGTRERDGDLTAIAVGLARDLTEASLPDVAAVMGQRFHTTAICAEQRWREWNDASRAMWRRIITARLPEPLIALERRERSFEGLLSAVCELYDLEPSEIADGHRLSPRLMLPRRLLIWCAGALLDMRNGEICERVNLDHVSIIRATEHMQRLVVIGEGIREEVRSIAAAMGIESPRLPAADLRIDAERRDD